MNLRQIYGTFRPCFCLNLLFHITITFTNNAIRQKKVVPQLICHTVRDSFVEMTHSSFQVQLQNHPVVERVWVTMSPGAYQKFAIFVVEILDGNTAEYKPCAQFEGRFHEQLVRFECNEGRGQLGQFVYIRDDRVDREYFGLIDEHQLVRRTLYQTLMHLCAAMDGGLLAGFGYCRVRIHPGHEG